MRVDIGAEFEALAPFDFSQSLDVNAAALALGAEVGVKVAAIYAQDPRDGALVRRRFPILVEIVDPGLRYSAIAGSSQNAVRIMEPGLAPDVVRVARGVCVDNNELNLGGIDDKGMALEETEAKVEEMPVEVDGDAAAVEEVTRRLSPEIAKLQRLWETASSLPMRLPQKEVLSLDASGAVRPVTVPEAAREPQEPLGSYSEAYEAWRQILAHEMDMLALEQRCCDQLASDLSLVERDLAGGRPPCVPVALMGLTRLPGGRSVLLPYADGNVLRFRIFEPSAKEGGVQGWAEEQRRRSLELWKSLRNKDDEQMAVVAASIEARREVDALAQLFECQGASQARGVRDSLQRSLPLGASYDLAQELDSLSAELDAIVEASPELQALVA